jgi:hypothetical protein
MKPAWKSDNGNYYNLEIDAAKADAEFWREVPNPPSQLPDEGKEKRADYLSLTGERFNSVDELVAKSASPEVIIHYFNLQLSELRAECEKLRKAIGGCYYSEEICVYCDSADKHKPGCVVAILEERDPLRARVAVLEKALTEIQKGEGEFNRDPLMHAGACIDSMKAIARAALNPK